MLNKLFSNPIAMAATFMSIGFLSRELGGLFFDALTGVFFTFATFAALLGGGI